MPDTDTRREFDSIVVGGGSAGYAAARTLAAGGHRTAVVDGAAELGGLCILRGCMPTKALLHAAEISHIARHAATWGIEVPEVRPDFAAIMARKDRLIDEFAAYRRGQLTEGRFTLVRGMARFTAPHTLEVQGGPTLKARHVVLATGSRVAHPPLPGLDEAHCLTSDDALKLSRLPSSLIVLGGGAVACEFSQFFARLGVRVTQIQRSARLLKELDPDLTAVVEAVFRREGIDLHTGTTFRSAGRTATGRFVTFLENGLERRVEADEILLALGRSPHTEGLNLDAIGVARDGERIVTHARLQTSVPHIYAAGDCTGLHEIVHLAVQQGELAAHNILHPGRPRERDDRLLLGVVFTDPQVAWVGLTEQAAQAGQVPYRAAHYRFDDHGKSLIMEARDGFVKLLADPRSGEILGGACIGPAGGELIHEITVAMARRMTVRELAAVPHYHPTLAEIWTYPAEALAEAIETGSPNTPA